MSLVARQTVIEAEGRGVAVTSARPFPPPFDRLGAVLWTIVKRKMSTQYDIAIVGGGIVGLATAVALSERTRYALIVIEGESRLAAHQTGSNSGVIHAGLYYAPGSLKARLCVAGRELMFRFCQEHGVPFERCGKLIVAVDDEEMARLPVLAERGQANGLTGLKTLTPSEMRAVEPHVVGLAGLWVPQTGIVDFALVAQRMAGILRAAGHEVRTGFCVRRVERDAHGLRLLSAGGTVHARFLINCGGLWSDRVARLCGVHPPVRIVPFRGEYYELVPQARKLVRNLIYPLPDPRFPFLGVHFTRTIDGRVLCGPNAVPAFRRDGYRWLDISGRDVLETLTYPGTWRLLGTYPSVCASEVRRSLSRRRFARSLQTLVPDVRSADLVPARSGVRAQAVDPQGRLVDDFLIIETQDALHVLNAPSPAATASLAIGRHIADRATERFELPRL